MTTKESRQEPDRSKKGRRGLAKGLIPDWLDHIFLRTVIPVIRELAVARINPDWLTMLGFLLSAVAGALVVLDRLVAAGLVALVAGILDFVDGKVAVLTGRVTKRGAILDTTLDRYSDAALTIGIAAYFAMEHHLLTALAAVLALVGSMMTSYLMALAKSQGFEFRLGMLRRQDRIALLVAGLLAAPAHEPIASTIAGLGGRLGMTVGALPAMPLSLVVIFLAVFSNITALQRFVHLLKLVGRSETSGRTPPAGPPDEGTEDGGESLRSKQLRTLRERIGTVGPSPVGAEKDEDEPARPRPYAELAMNFLIDAVAVRLRIRRFRPLMTNFYVTKRCNLRCRFCYPPGDEPELPVAAATALLAKIRPHNPALNITGGEPLLYPGISRLLRRARELRFRPLVLSTNGLLIDRVAADLHLVDHVVLSLDSLSEETNEELTGVPGSTRKIVAAIESCAALSREQGIRMSLHAVVAPETIDGIEEVLDFCAELGAGLTISPEHGRFRPHSGLPENRRYVELIDRLRLRKRRGDPLVCSDGYLRAIRDFRPHGCFPFLSPRVEPDGRVYLPCQRMKSRWVMLEDYPSLHRLMQREAAWRVTPDCARRCFLACYLEVDRYLRSPLSAMRELALGRLMLPKDGGRK